MDEHVASALEFPGYYGGNLDALNDCLADVAMRNNGSDSRGSGLAVAISGYDSYAFREERDSAAVADIFATAARRGLLFGRRMLLLPQVMDPDFSLPRSARLAAHARDSRARGGRTDHRSGEPTRHSRSSFTADTHTRALPEVDQEAADLIARLVRLAGETVVTRRSS